MKKFLRLWLLGLAATVALLASLGLWRGWGRCPPRRRARFLAGLAAGWPVTVGSIIWVGLKGAEGGGNG